MSRSAAGVVVVGGGQAGFETATSLRAEGYDGRITIVGDEALPPYQRPPLSKSFLTGDGDFGLLCLASPDELARQQIEVLTGARVTAIERVERRVVVGGTKRIAYDHLVLATGARNRIVAPCRGLPGIRTAADALVVAERLRTASRLVVVGGGFLGLEIASTAIDLGLAVDVVEAADRAMSRSVSAATSEALTARHRARGVRVHLGRPVAAVRRGGADEAIAVDLAGGGTIRADLVVSSIGIVPNTALAEAAGLPVADGISVDRFLVTADPAISAIGDCAAFPGRGGDPIRLESVQNAVDQGRCVAARIAGRALPYEDLPWFWSDQSGKRLQIAGLTQGHDAAIVVGDREALKQSVFCFRKGALIGVESIDRPADHMAARRLLRSGIRVDRALFADRAFSFPEWAKAALAAA